MEKFIGESVSSLKTLLTGFGRNEEARKRYLKERQRFIRELNQSGIFPPRELLERGTLHEIQAWATARLDDAKFVARLKRWHDNAEAWKELVALLRKVNALEDENGQPRTTLRCGRDSEAQHLARAKEFLTDRERTLMGAHGFRTKLGSLLNKQEVAPTAR